MCQNHLYPDSWDDLNPPHTLYLSLCFNLYIDFWPNSLKTWDNKITPQETQIILLACCLVAALDLSLLTIIEKKELNQSIQSMVVIFHQL